VSLREKLTAARERQRQEGDAQKAGQRRIFKLMELEKFGLSTSELADTLTEADLEAVLAAEKERRARLYETLEGALAMTKFKALGVQVLAGDDMVYTIGHHDPWEKTNDSWLLGALTGAEAQVTDTTSAFSPGKAMLMPLATAPLARKETADALIIFTNGTTRVTPLDGSQAVRDARRQAVEFNLLAGAFSPATAAAGSDPSARLRKLQELRDAGLLSQEEYEIKRTEVINSI
jgi:Short C-terminal domain